MPPAGWRTRGGGSRALPQRRLQIGRASVFVQQVAERLISKLLKRLHGLAREQVERVPRLRIKPHELAPNLCWLLGHVKLPLKQGAIVAAQVIISTSCLTSGLNLVFADIEGKLDVLRVECTKCARKGRYSVRRLIEKYGRKANMMKWREQLNGDCPKRDAHSIAQICPR